jgi:hypothetical protein
MFLVALAPGVRFFDFRAIDDNKARSLPPKKLRGSLAIWRELARLNGQGRGIFVTINETDGRGVLIENITRVRAVWYDDDGKAPVPAFPVAPSMIVRTSRGKRHFYWFVGDMTPEQFAGVMRCMVSLGSDKGVIDAARVLRLPGSLHAKGEPQLVEIIEATGKRYTGAELAAAFPAPIDPERPAAPFEPGGTEGDRRGDIEAALAQIPSDDRGDWIRVGMALKAEFGDAGRGLWDDWSRTSAKFNAKDQERKWRSFRREGVGGNTIFHMAQERGWRNERSGDDALEKQGEAAVTRLLASKPQTSTPKAADEPQHSIAKHSDRAWPEPQPLVSKINALPYPVEALPSTVRAAVEEQQAVIKLPLELVAGCALSAMSAAVQGLVDVERMNGLSGPVSLFLLTVAMSGDRKTTVDKRFTKAIVEYEREQAAKHAPLLQKYEADFKIWKSRDDGYQGAIKAKMKSSSKGGKSLIELENDLHANQAKKPSEPRVPQILRGDETSENLAFVLAKAWPSAAIISSEAGLVFGGHAMGAETIMRYLALQNTIWDGGEHKVGRRTSESFIVRGARLTIGMQVQSEALDSFCEKNGTLARGMGYFARFLLAHPRSIQGEREIEEEPPETQPAIEAFSRRMATLLNTPLNIEENGALSPHLMKMTPEGKAAWIEIHNSIERQLKPDGKWCDVRDVAAKAADNIARLAAIFHVFECGIMGRIEADHVQRAGRIGVWHLNEARRVLGEFSMPPELAAAARLEEWVLDDCRIAGVPGISRQRVQQYATPCYLRKKKALDPALAELEELGRARDVKVGRGREIHVNPALLSGGAQ